MFDLPIRPSFAQSLAVAAQKPSPSEAPSGGSDLIMGSKRCSTALSDIALIVRPLLATWRQLREQIAVFDKAVQQQARMDPIETSDGANLRATLPGSRHYRRLLTPSIRDYPRSIH